MLAATLESRLEELGLRSSFSRPRVSNENPYTKITVVNNELRA
jgi:hypothetical protein